MVIAFDTWVLKSSHQNSGIYNYAKNVLRELRALVSAGEELTIRPFFTQGYSDGAVDLASSPGIEILNTRLLRFHRLWQLGGITAAAVRARANLIFSPTTHTCPFGPIPVITTIHDVTPLLSPSFGRFTNLLERIRLWNAAKFSIQCITDSECSKRDLVEIYGLPPEKVKVVYLGYDRETFNPSLVDSGRQKVLLDRLGIHDPYIFHHGTIQPRKNLARLIRACRLLWDRRRDLRFQLVLAGQLGWQYQGILEAANGVGGAGKVVFTGAMSDEDLALLLKGAELCVIPSLYEGFCLPMVEAMACGTPTIASKTSCLPEVSGGVLRYFDPLSTEDMANTIAMVLEDRTLQQELVENGVRRASDFSWKRCAREVLELVRQNGNGRVRTGPGWLDQAHCPSELRPNS